MTTKSPSTTTAILRSRESKGNLEVTVSVRAVSQNGKYALAGASAPVIDGVPVNAEYSTLVECIASESPYRLAAGAIDLRTLEPEQP